MKSRSFIPYLPNMSLFKHAMKYRAFELREKNTKILYMCSQKLHNNIKFYTYSHLSFERGKVLISAKIQFTLQVGEVKSITVDGNRQLKMKTVNLKPLVFGKCLCFVYVYLHILPFLYPKKIPKEFTLANMEVCLLKWLTGTWRQTAFIVHAFTKTTLPWLYLKICTSLVLCVTYISRLIQE